MVEYRVEHQKWFDTVSGDAQTAPDNSSAVDGAWGLRAVVHIHRNRVGMVVTVPV